MYPDNLRPGCIRRDDGLFDALIFDGNAIVWTSYHYDSAYNATMYAHDILSDFHAGRYYIDFNSGMGGFTITPFGGN